MTRTSLKATPRLLPPPDGVQAMMPHQAVGLAVLHPFQMTYEYSTMSSAAASSAAASCAQCAVCSIILPRVFIIHKLTRF